MQIESRKFEKLGGFLDEIETVSIHKYNLII